MLNSALKNGFLCHFVTVSLRTPGALQKDVFGYRQEGFEIAVVKLLLQYVQSSIGQGLQPLMGFFPHLVTLPVQICNE